MFLAMAPRHGPYISSWGRQQRQKPGLRSLARVGPPLSPKNPCKSIGRMSSQWGVWGGLSGRQAFSNIGARRENLRRCTRFFAESIPPCLQDK